VTKHLAAAQLPPADRYWNMVNPLEFLQEVRAEADKVTWPSRRETMITTALVIFMVLITSLFFVLVDWLIRLIVTAVLGMGQ
jgi:preprotein translocase subunit SecE